MNREGVSLGGSEEHFRRLFLSKESEVENLKREVGILTEQLYNSYKKIDMLNKRVQELSHGDTSTKTTRNR